MKKLFYLLSLSIILISCKDSSSIASGVPDESIIKITNLYNTGISFADSLNFAKAISIYDELSMEPDGFNKSEDLKEIILKKKTGALESLNKKKAAQLKNVYSDYDEFKKMTWYKPLSEKNEYKNSIYSYFGVKDSGEINPLRLVIVYYGDDWIFWNKANFLIEGKSFVYIPENSPTTDNNSSVWEISDEPVDSASEIILAQIYSAKEVKYRLEGKSNVADFKLSKSKQKGLKDVYDLYNTINSITELTNFK